MPSFCLNCVIKKELYERATAIGYSFGMSGSVEESSEGDVVCRIYFPKESQACDAMESLRTTLSVKDCSIEYVEDQDWNEKWRRSMKPAELSDGYWVSPVWLEPPEQHRKAWIKIEPKMAFGTGHHETTRLAAAQMICIKEQLSGKRLLDIGTGSGVLCFVADLCGCSLSIGLEIDRECRENLAENRVNNLRDGSVSFAIGTPDCLGDSCSFDIIVMNMLFNESQPLLKKVYGHLPEHGLLILSGILHSQRNELLEHTYDSGFEIADEKIENEWWSGQFIKR